MRRSFAVLVLLLVAVSAWAAWKDAFPPWRRYQRELIRREIDRLTAELADARSELERPTVRADLARLDEALRTAGTDSAVDRVDALRARVAALDAEIDRIYAELRRVDVDRERPAAAQARKDLSARLEAAHGAYVAATGSWPPDTLQLARLWATRDAIAEQWIAMEGPAQELRARLEAKQAEASLLRVEMGRIGAPRDSLLRMRSRLLAPVTTREAALEKLRRLPLRLREIASADGMEVARCPTCHGTLDDPPGAHPTMPAADALRDVPCTVCHGGRGRALDVKHAHRGLLSAAGLGAGPHSLRGRIARLASADAAEREEAREELRRLTRLDPAQESAGGGDSTVAAAWARWWLSAESYFDPTDSEADDSTAVAAGGLDPFTLSVRGRPLKYVGSAKCLGCHEVLHREHSRRWLTTKFRSIERLAGVTDPRPCLPCHSTGYDPTTGKYVEPGVTCEGCHGPGERYDEMMVVGQELVAKGDGVRGRALLAHSARLAREAVSRRLVGSETGDNNVCVTCHHPRQQRAGCPGILDRKAPEESDAIARADTEE
jgi:hypothetical protein